jgi:hypothetical protein
MAIRSDTFLLVIRIHTLNEEFSCLGEDKVGWRIMGLHGRLHTISTSGVRVSGILIRYDHAKGSRKIELLIRTTGSAKCIRMFKPE